MKLRQVIHDLVESKPLEHRNRIVYATILNRLNRIDSAENVLLTGYNLKTDALISGFSNTASITRSECPNLRTRQMYSLDVVSVAFELNHWIGGTDTLRHSQELTQNVLMGY